MVKRLTLAAAVLGFGLAVIGSVGAAADTDAAVSVTNNSSWHIFKIYLSPVDQTEWGDDVLGEEAIASNGGAVQLINIPCDAYDVKLVDEDGDECVVNAVALCADKGAWVIEDEALLACQADTAG